MPTFKALVFAHHLKDDGTYNVKVRVTHNRKVKYISTQEYVKKHEVTKKMLIKNQDVEDSLNRIIKGYRDKCRKLGERVRAISIEELIKELTKPDESERFDINFIEFGRLKADEMELSGRKGSADNYRTTLNSLIRFKGRENISISEITARFLDDYSKWLISSKSPTKRDIGNRAISLYAGYIRALHNMAKKEYNEEDLGAIRIPWSPFSKFTIPKQPVTRKRALTKDQLLNIINFKTGKQRRAELAKDVFILSFFLIGMNTADLFDCKEYKGGRITYKRAKTKDRRLDEALISIKVEPEALPLFKKYIGSDRVFRFNKDYSTRENFNGAINKGLKKIGAAIGVNDLEFYAARHTWATLAINEVGIDKYTVHTALNHVDNSMRVTDIYIKKDWRIIDKANRKVIDYVKDRL